MNNMLTKDVSTATIQKSVSTIRVIGKVHQRSSDCHITDATDKVLRTGDRMLRCFETVGQSTKVHLTHLDTQGFRVEFRSVIKTLV